MHALRTIAPGEELTITYIDGAQARAARQAALRRAWGFECQCSACAAPPALAAASDARLALIADLRAALAHPDHALRADLPRVEALVALCEMEGLLAPAVDAYGFAAREYSGVGDAWTAVKWAVKAVEAGLLYGGPEDRDVRDLQELLRDPRSHWSWLRKVNETSGQQKQ